MVSPSTSPAGRKLSPPRAAKPHTGAAPSQSSQVIQHGHCHFGLQHFPILIKTGLPLSSDSLVSAIQWLEIHFNEGRHGSP